MVLLITRLLIFLSYQASSICFTLTGIIVFACEGFDIDDCCDECCVYCKFLFRLITEVPGSLAYQNQDKISDKFAEHQTRAKKMLTKMFTEFYLDAFRR
jgi:hypothetical protein